MNHTMLAATRLPLTTLLAIGAFGSFLIILFSYSNWRRAVKVAMVAALIEGAIRKWVFPSGQELVYFLKDVFLIGAYLKFYLAPDLDVRAYRLRIPMTFVMIGCGLVCLPALNSNIGSPILALYGVKIYLFYIPLMFMMPYLFRSEKEMVRQLTWYTFLAIPICSLGFLQWRSDTFSVLNTYATGTLETGATSFGIGDTSKSRITGTFSYITGHTTFVVVFAMLCLMLLSLKETRFRWALMGLALPMLIGNALMNGARASIVSIVFVAAGFGVAALSGRVGSSKKFLPMLITGAVIAVAAAVYLFADALSMLSARFKYSGDSLTGRLAPVGTMTLAARDGGTFGYGIGMSHPAVEAMRKKLGIPLPAKKCPSYDQEPGQILVELGFLGFAGWYSLRALILILIWSGYKKSPPGPVRAVCLGALLINIPFFSMSMVYNHTANFFICATAGMALIPLVEPVIRRRHVSPGIKDRQDYPRVVSGVR